jgi:uncharacterized protein (DUF302 family)
MTGTIAGLARADRVLALSSSPGVAGWVIRAPIREEHRVTSPFDEYAFRVELDADHPEALRLTKDALRAEGFGVLTEIDVKATLKEKLGADFRSYTILGACNPPLAHRALGADPEVGLLLPCNVIVYDRGTGAGSLVSLVDPISMLGDVSEPELQAVAQEAHARLARVAEVLRS